MDKDKLKKIILREKYVIAGTIILFIFCTIVIAGLFNIKRYYEKQKQELSKFNLDAEIDRYYAGERKQNEERYQQEAVQEEYQAREESRLQREEAMQEEQIRLQKAAIVLQMMQSMPRPQYQAPSYQSSQKPKRYNINIRPTVINSPGSPQVYEGTVQEER